MKFELIAVDLQNEFATEGGRFYSYKPSVEFLQDQIFPYLKDKGLKINEIISDYRQPRPGDEGDGCHPGTWGYRSLVPEELRKSLWIKCMNSPIWIREGVGEADQVAGKPYPDPVAFDQWIETNIGTPETTRPAIFGLTIDCCVLAVVQEFRWRGFEPLIIEEAVDHASGREEDKRIVLEKTALRWWAETLSWNELKEALS